MNQDDGGKCYNCSESIEPKYRFHCPVCDRDGCPECIPAGRGCLCPECEEAEENEP
jgi:hypothetical protein